MNGPKDYIGQAVAQGIARDGKQATSPFTGFAEQAAAYEESPGLRIERLKRELAAAEERLLGNRLHPSAVVEKERADRLESALQRVSSIIVEALIGLQR